MDKLSITKLRHDINSLIYEHEELAELVEHVSSENDPVFITRVKKRKLMLKDNINFLQQKLKLQHSS